MATRSLEPRRFGNYLFLCVVLLFSALPRAASAHPVAQGGLELFVSDASILNLKIRASYEQVFLERAHASKLTIGSPWEAHAEYLRQHIAVRADGRALPGTVVRASSSDSQGTPNFAEFVLEYRGFTDAEVLTFQQNVLNELEFAPGNRWEATFIVTIRTPAGESLPVGILTSKEDLTLRRRDIIDTKRNTTSGLELCKLYLRHGFGHILEGYDHLLFVSALVLAVASLWELIKVVTAFTLAHTLTLALAVLNIVRLPSSIVEPMIAFSIVFVALQNVFWPRAPERNRLLVAFGFGLFHGLGFAGGLLDAMAELPHSSVIIAIAAFSLGVELGHQCIVLPLYASIRGLSMLSSDANRAVLRYGSFAISLGGAYFLYYALT